MTPAPDLAQFVERFAAVRRERAQIADPPDEVVSWPIVSVDDHLVEPPDTFEGRLAAKFADRAPRVVEDETGMERWLFEDRTMEIVGANASVSWPLEEMTSGPVRFDQLRRGAWDVHARIEDMDRCGVAGSLCFPSMVFGFAGRRFLEFEDKELALACVRAYNDWMFEAWCGPYPDRLISSQIPVLWDVDLAVAEIERNAARGVRSVSFSENPQKLGLASIHTGHWDRFLAACADTSTVVNLHVGSSSETIIPSTDSPLESMTVLFQVSSLSAAADWLFSGIPLRFPTIRFALSEGGVGWVPAFLDRLDYIVDRYPRGGDGGVARTWFADETPAQVFMRNFWFTAIDDPTAFGVITGYADSRIDHFMTEVDYPHIDSTWPRVQETLRHQLGGLADDLAAKFAYGNACDLYRMDVSTIAGMFASRRS